MVCIVQWKYVKYKKSQGHYIQFLNPKNIVERLGKNGLQRKTFLLYSCLNTVFYLVGKYIIPTKN